ncbi:bifunctional transcriptional activator/DNA repair enzyme AdaA [Niastella sp. OAS944]|uniref:bifunctional transcriptional activator/DNA repair enzyme AdaA n=1 Tax=Niastella sp. OAS944 TaxID=2664089 RepID=UPI003470FF09|nr:AraC family transcriptional regulator of adaptative response/methylated-DNA-[protein]-cysteine methyltransferase [Chitinophagaceae bacterium OAS944]
MELTFEIMYKACLEKDESFEGMFFTAVKTTGVFCRPSCTARKPKKENVTFFFSAKESILKGYRPCKVCRPLEKLNETPSHIRDLLNEITEDPACKIKDADLIKRGIDPFTLRRWFIKNHGITFQAYQRMFRINTAFKKIQDGERVTSAAYASGFESVSGFADSFKQVFGVSPNKSKVQVVIDLKRLETPLGTMYACATSKGVCLLEFTDRKMLETEFKSLARILNATIVQGDNRHFDILEQQLAEYFEGKRTTFTVPLHTPGSEFQRSVWMALREVPYATTVSYSQLVASLHRAEAVRAVANANGYNRVSILVPCHRIIGANGALTGYGGGIWRKKWLLDFEMRTKEQLTLS